MPLCILILTLTLTCASCRNDPPPPPINPPAPKPTATTPTEVVDSTATAPEPQDENPFAGCDMCHIDVADELAGTQHQTHGIGCIKCHGPSIAHTQDENNEVEPDQIFTPENIDPFCTVCHPCTRPPAQKPTAQPQICTNCHNPHTTRLTGIAITPNS
ncbi:MAG: hypothetical protein ACYTA5_22235 [Planctomycetota bacterium]